MPSLKWRKTKQSQLKCLVCKRNEACIDNAPKIKCRINPASGRITRSLTRLMKAMNDFIILEIYRCMPLLGNEEQVCPSWEVHIVHYAIVFLDLPGPKKYYREDYD